MESFQKSVLKRLGTFEDKFEERLRSLEVGRTKSDTELEQVNYIFCYFSGIVSRVLNLCNFIF
jgi:hypothetical protein